MLIEPIYFIPLNTCRHCLKGELYFIEKEITVVRLDKYGSRIDAENIGHEGFLQCDECGKTSDFTVKGFSVIPVDHSTREIEESVIMNKYKVEDYPNPLTSY